MEANPRPHGCKRLKGKQALYRVRTGDYRIIYTLNDNQLLVLVVKIGNRRDVYQK
ncbi:MAG: type II toxin-antitoxin system RelE family toxin [Planctomycetota bacterium]